MAKTILIVDDSSSLRQVVAIVLKGAGYNVIEAGDGKEALQRLKASGRVNLIISDVNMPNMDGIVFLTEVKKQPEHKFTPVIMLTTEAQDAAKQRGRDAGAKAWIVKPFQPAEMLSAVSKLIMP